MAHYADTSFLVSLYVPDAFSSRAQAWLAKQPVAFPLTDFGRVELRSALARLAFTHALTALPHSGAWQMVQADLGQGRLLAHALPWPDVLARDEHDRPALPKPRVSRGMRLRQELLFRPRRSRPSAE